MPGIEEKNAEHFVGKRTHRCNQISVERGVQGIDANRSKRRAHAFDHRVAHALEIGLDCGPVGQDACDALGRLRPKAPQVLEFRQQDGRYLLAFRWFDERQERNQERSLPFVRSRFWCRQVASARSGGRSQDAATCIVR